MACQRVAESEARESIRRVEQTKVVPKKKAFCLELKHHPSWRRTRFVGRGHGILNARAAGQRWQKAKLEKIILRVEQTKVLPRSDGGEIKS